MTISTILGTVVLGAMVLSPAPTVRAQAGGAVVKVFVKNGIETNAKQLAAVGRRTAANLETSLARALEKKRGSIARVRREADADLVLTVGANVRGSNTYATFDVKSRVRTRGFGGEEVGYLTGHFGGEDVGFLVSGLGGDDVGWRTRRFEEIAEDIDEWIGKHRAPILRSR